MRNYIRHPSEFPIELRVPEDGREERPPTKNVSAGGLCCQSGKPLPVGTHVHVRIPVGERPFESEGTVAWCSQTPKGGWDVGIRFASDSVSFGLRMIEQVCQIQRYRREIREREGRELDEEQAAQEWIARYAATFPK